MHEMVPWTSCTAASTTPVTYHDGWPDVRNAFRPHTVDELYRCLDTPA